MSLHLTVLILPSELHNNLYLQLIVTEIKRRQSSQASYLGFDRLQAVVAEVEVADRGQREDVRLHE